MNAVIYHQSVTIPPPAPAPESNSAVAAAAAAAAVAAASSATAATSAAIDSIVQQQHALQEQIKQSEQNLSAQHQVSVTTFVPSFV